MYNIGSHEGETSLIDLAGIMAKLLKKKVRIAKIPYPAEYPPDEPSRRCPDITKARHELRYAPEVDLKTGLTRMITWYEETYPRASARTVKKTLGLVRVKR